MDFKCVYFPSMEQRKQLYIDEYDLLCRDYNRFLDLPYIENILIHIKNLFNIHTKSTQSKNTLNTIISHLYVHGFVIIVNKRILNSQTINLHYIRNGKLPQGYHYIRNLPQYAYSSNINSRLPGGGIIFLFQNVAPVYSEVKSDIVPANASSPVKSCRVQLICLSLFARNVTIRDILNAEFPDFATIESKRDEDSITADKIMDFNEELNDQTTVIADRIVHPATKNGGNDFLLYMKTAIYIVISTLGLKPHMLGHLQPYAHIDTNLNRGTEFTKYSILTIVRTIVEVCNIKASVFLSNAALPEGILGLTQNKRKRDLKDIYGENPDEYVLEDYTIPENNEKSKSEPQEIVVDEEQKRKRKKRPENV